MNGGEPPRPLPGDQAPSSLAFLLSQVGTFASQRFGEAIAELDLHPPLFRVLNLVDVAEGQSQQWIGEAIQVPPSRMVAIVDELEERGLLTRRLDPGDRRVRALYLTAKGRRVLAEGREIAEGHERRLTRGMSKKDCEQLAALLRKLADSQGLPGGVHPALSNPEE